MSETAKKVRSFRQQYHSVRAPNYGNIAQRMRELEGYAEPPQRILEVKPPKSVQGFYTDSSGTKRPITKPITKQERVTLQVMRKELDAPTFISKSGTKVEILENGKYRVEDNILTEDEFKDKYPLLYEQLGQAKSRVKAI